MQRWAPRAPMVTRNQAPTIFLLLVSWGHHKLQDAYCSSYNLIYISLQKGGETGTNWPEAQPCLCLLAAIISKGDRKKSKKIPFVPFLWSPSTPSLFGELFLPVWIPFHWSILMIIAFLCHLAFFSQLIENWKPKRWHVSTEAPYIYWMSPATARSLGETLVPQKKAIHIVQDWLVGDSVSFITNSYTHCALFVRDVDFYFRLLHTTVGI